jgi:hypothetical protein
MPFKTFKTNSFILYFSQISSMIGLLHILVSVNRFNCPEAVICQFISYLAGNIAFSLNMNRSMLFRSKKQIHFCKGRLWRIGILRHVLHLEAPNSGRLYNAMRSVTTFHWGTPRPSQILTSGRCRDQRTWINICLKCHVMMYRLNGI